MRLFDARQVFSDIKRHPQDLSFVRFKKFPLFEGDFYLAALHQEHLLSQDLTSELDEADYQCIIPIGQTYVSIPVSAHEAILLSRIDPWGRYDAYSEETLTLFNRLREEILEKYNSKYTLGIGYDEGRLRFELVETGLQEPLSKIEEAYPYHYMLLQLLKHRFNSHQLLTRMEVLLLGYEYAEINRIIKHAGLGVADNVANVAWKLGESTEQDYFKALNLNAKHAWSAFEGKLIQGEVTRIGCAGNLNLEKLDIESKYLPYDWNLYKLSGEETAEICFILAGVEGEIFELMFNHHGYLDAGIWEGRYEDSRNWPPSFTLFRSINKKLIAAGLELDPRPIISGKGEYRLNLGNPRLDLLKSISPGAPSKTAISHPEVSLSKQSTLELAAVAPFSVRTDPAERELQFYRVECETGAEILEAGDLPHKVFEWLQSLPGLNQDLLTKLISTTLEKDKVHHSIYLKFLELLADEGIATVSRLKMAGFSRYQINNLIGVLYDMGIFTENVLGIGWCLPEHISGKPILTRDQGLNLIARQLGEQYSESESLASRAELELASVAIPDELKVAVPGLKLGLHCLCYQDTKLHLWLTPIETKVLELMVENSGYVNKAIWASQSDLEDNSAYHSLSVLQAKLKLANAGREVIIVHPQGGYSLFKPSRTRALWQQVKKFNHSFELGQTTIRLVEVEQILPDNPQLLGYGFDGNEILASITQYGRARFIQLSSTELLVVKVFKAMGGNPVVPSRDLPKLDFFPQEHIHLFKAYYLSLWKKFKRHRLAKRNKHRFIDRSVANRLEYHWFYE